MNLENFRDQDKLTQKQENYAEDHDDLEFRLEIVRHALVKHVKIIGNVLRSGTENEKTIFSHEIEILFRGLSEGCRRSIYLERL